MWFLGYGKLQLNVDFVVVLLGEIVGVETAVLLNVDFIIEEGCPETALRYGQVLGTFKVLVCWYKFQDA